MFLFQLKFSQFRVRCSRKLREIKASTFDIIRSFDRRLFFARFQRRALYHWLIIMF